jgi:hypothetical protein
MDLNDSSQLEAVNRMAKFSIEYYNTKYKEKVRAAIRGLLLDN